MSLMSTIAIPLWPKQMNIVEESSEISKPSPPLS